LSINTDNARIFALLDAGFLRTARIAQNVVHVVLPRPSAIRAGRLRAERIGTIRPIAVFTTRLRL
jgi:hypothetical protein